ncbi:MAG: hypothetical protein MUO62_02480 [Anaerolineales bacterium]|nr:hypothetical protein [Anaerolineales bacterium]
MPKPSKTPSPTQIQIIFHPRATVIGRSLEGPPIEIFRFGYGTDERLNVAGVLGRYEWNTISLAETIAAVSPYPYPTIDGGCEFTAQMADWMSSQGIAAVNVELTNYEETYFEQNLAILEVSLTWEP